MAAPLIFKGARLGALVVDALGREATFTPTDLAMLEDFAQIAAIAIVNAQLYGSEHTKRVRLEVLNDEITRQRDDLNKRLFALDSMSEIARHELGLPALANRLADLTSSRAYILDGLTRVRSTERDQADTDHLRELLRSERCLELLRRVAQNRHRYTAAVGSVQLTISPIVSGPDLLGYVVLEATSPASPNVNEAQPTWRRSLHPQSLSASERLKRASCGGEPIFSAGCSVATRQKAPPRSRRCPLHCDSPSARFARAGPIKVKVTLTTISCGKSAPLRNRCCAVQ